MHVRQVETAAELLVCLHIRRTVFIEEQGVSEADELDEKDPLCRHFLATEDRLSPATRALGTARLLVLDGLTAKAQRVAVLRSHRKRGVGEALMFALEGAAARGGCRMVKLSSQVSALPFYQRLGYEAEGAVYTEAGIPHRDMHKAIR